MFAKLPLEILEDNRLNLNDLKLISTVSIFSNRGNFLSIKLPLIKSIGLKSLDDVFCILSRLKKLGYISNTKQILRIEIR